MIQVKNIRMTGLLLVMLAAAVLPVGIAWGSYRCQKPCGVQQAASVPYNTVASALQGGDLPGFPSVFLFN